MLIEKLEYEGKQYIEFNFTFQCVLGFIFALTLIMAFFSARLYWQSEAIKNDPLVYGAKIYDVENCYCVNTNGVGFTFNKSQVWSTQEVKSMYEPLDISMLNFTE